MSKKKKLFYTILVLTGFALLIRNLCTVTKPSYLRRGGGKLKLHRPEGNAACVDPDVRPRKQGKYMY